MAISSNKLLETKADALEAKRAFESEYGDRLSACAVGLGLNASKDGWVVKVYCQTGEAGSALPDHFGRFEVDVEVSGPITAS